MIRDTTLAALCNSLGAILMALIISYHFIVVNSKESSENSENVEKKHS
jgi:hypothetical protein